MQSKAKPGKTIKPQVKVQDIKPKKSPKGGRIDGDPDGPLIP